MNDVSAIKIGLSAVLSILKTSFIFMGVSITFIDIIVFILFASIIGFLVGGLLK